MSDDDAAATIGPLPVAFPHRALTRFEAMPPISTALAGELLDALKECEERGINRIEGAAIILVVWQGPLVKYLTNEAEASDTLERIRRRLAQPQ